jgi:hypothetical protein
MRMGGWWIRVVLVGLFVLTTCGGSDAVVPPATRPSTSARLGIASPDSGAVIRTDHVNLVVELEGAELSDAASTDLRPNQGHLHVTLDDQLISMTSGLEQVLPGLTPGDHLLKVEFVANDHAPFEPRVSAAVSFRVKPK